MACVRQGAECRAAVKGLAGRLAQLCAFLLEELPGGPEGAAFLKKDNERWAQVIKASGVKAE